MPKIRCSYQLHIQLQDVKPAVWRRIVIADHTTLAQLHSIIQIAMGWQHKPDYAFEIAGQRYGIPNPDWPDDRTMDARRYTVSQLLQGQPLGMRYTYGFGNGWIHRLKLEGCAPASAQQLDKLPLCVSGRNACPPENCSTSMVWQSMPSSMHAHNNEIAAIQAGLNALRAATGKKSSRMLQADALTN